MQRVCWSLLALARLGPLAPHAHAVRAGQASAGAELWRLAATTVPLPPALSSGGAGAFWNPAQPATRGRAAVALELIETAPTVGASGVLVTARGRTERFGDVGVVYGRMAMSDLVRTSLSPEPDPGMISYYTQTLGATWSATAAGTTVGVTLAHQNTTLDVLRSSRWTLDLGGRRTFRDVVTLAAATHFFSRFSTREPGQELYAGAELRLWRGPLWGGRATVRARYGVANGRGFSADHLVGAGVEQGSQFAADVVAVRAGSFGSGAWRAVAGARLSVGRYRLSFARDAGLNDIGAAYRVGLEARIP